MLTTTEFALAIGISDSSARRMADSGDVEIHRTRGGHRRIPVTEAIRYVRESGATIVRPELLGLTADATGLTPDNYDSRLLNALCEGHSAHVTGILQAMFAAGSSIADICDGPVRSAMSEIGRRHPFDRRAIFVEHRATALCVRALHQLYLSLPSPDDAAPEAIGAAPAGDVYLMPSLMASLVVHESGMAETNLGPNTPLDVLIDAVNDEHPALAWLSLSTPILSRTTQLEIEKLAAATAGVGGQLIIGGRYASSFDVPDGLPIATCDSMGELAEIAGSIAETSQT